MNLEKGIELILDKLTGWWIILVKMLPNFLLASIVLFLFFVFARWIRNVSCRVLMRISKSDSIAALMSAIIYSLIIIVGLMTALNIMNLDKTVSSLLAGVGIIGLALGFAFQDLTANFIAGAFMAFKRPFEVGHKIETNGFIGKIDHIQLRSTTMITDAGLYVIIPNKDIFQKPIINYSQSPNRRVELEFAVLSSVDLSYVEEVVRNAIQKIESKNPISDIRFYFTAIDDPKVKLAVSFQIDNKEPKGFMTTRHKAIVAIYKAFAESNMVKITTSREPKPVESNGAETQADITKK